MSPPPWGKRDGFVVHEAEPFNGEPRPADLAGRALTPDDAFYARNHGPVPDGDPETWRLEVAGLAERPLALSLADLRSGFPPHQVVATLQCAGNRRAGLIALRPIPDQAPWGSGAISTASWDGVRLADVLAAAAPLPGARHVGFEGPDVAPEAVPPQPYGASIGLAKARAPEVLLAWGMNGRPLPRAHGGPLRVVVPGYVGARSVKWLRRVTLLPEPSDNYFQAVAYRLRPATADHEAANDGPPLERVGVTSDILSPATGDTVAAGRVEVSGYAFAGGRDVAAVGVSVDDGVTWRHADIAEADGPWAWRLWTATVDLVPGRATIIARAVDAQGQVQPAEAGPLWNPKGYANTCWPRVSVTVT